MVSKAELIEFTSHSEYFRSVMLIQRSNRVTETTNTTDKSQG